MQSLEIPLVKLRECEIYPSDTPKINRIFTWTVAVGIVLPSVIVLLVSANL